MKTYYFSIIIEVELEDWERAKSLDVEGWDFDNGMFFKDEIASSEEEMEEMLEEAKDDFIDKDFCVVDYYTELINVDNIVF